MEMSFEFMMWKNNPNANEHTNVANVIYCLGDFCGFFLLLIWEIPSIYNIYNSYNSYDSYNSYNSYNYL